jgi:hypothetical protein
MEMNFSAMWTGWLRFSSWVSRFNLGGLIKVAALKYFELPKKTRQPKRVEPQIHANYFVHSYLSIQAFQSCL